MTDAFNKLPDKKKREILDSAVKASNKDQRELYKTMTIKEEFERDFPVKSNQPKMIWRDEAWNWINEKLKQEYLRGREECGDCLEEFNKGLNTKVVGSGVAEGVTTATNEPIVIKHNREGF